MTSLMKTSSTLAVVATAATLTGCGGSGSSSSVSAASYVKSVCQAIGPFERDIQQRSNALNLSGIKNAASGKKELVGFLQAASSDTANTVSKLQAAGTPQVGNGKKISKAIVQVFSRLNTALSHAAQQGQSLPTSSASAFRTAAESLGSSVKSSMSNIGQGLTGLRNPALEKAAAKEKACTTIG